MSQRILNFELRILNSTAFLLPKANRQVLVYFGDPIFLQTDIVLVYFWVPDALLLFIGRAKPYSLEDGTWCLQRELGIGEQRCCCLEAGQSPTV